MLDCGPSTLHPLANRVARINQSELHQLIEWIIIIMSRASVYAVLNSEVVVDIYQLMKLLVDQAVADFSMDESKCAPVSLASSS
jgi:hypothetical protein